MILLIFKNLKNPKTLEFFAKVLVFFGHFWIFPMIMLLFKKISRTQKNEVFAKSSVLIFFFSFPMISVFCFFHDFGDFQQKKISKKTDYSGIL